MKRRSILEVDHSKINWGVKQLLRIGNDYGIELQFKLADRMAERNLTVRELSEITGLRLATISDIMNGNRSSINFQHIVVLMMALKITKLSDMVDIAFPEYLVNYYEEQSSEWINFGEQPSETLLYKNCHTLSESQQEECEETIPQARKELSVKLEELKTKYGAKK